MPPCEKGASQRRPSLAQRLALDKASVRLPCAASVQVARAHAREREGRRRTWRRPMAIPEFWLIRSEIFKMAVDYVNQVHDRMRDSFVSLHCLTRSARTDSPRKIGQNKFRRTAAAAATSGDDGGFEKSHSPKFSSHTQHIELSESRIQYLCDSQWFRDTASRGPTTIAAPESQFRTCPTDHDSIGYPRISASGESSTTMHRLLHASGSHPISPPDDPKTNQYNQDLGLFHSTNGNHLESPNEGSSIDHQVTIHLHAQNITMFPTNETWYFVSQMLVSSSGGLILILTAQSTRNEFRMHRCFSGCYLAGDWRLAPTRITGRLALHGSGGRLRLIRSMTGSKVPSSACTRRPDKISTDGNSSKSWPEQIPARQGGGAARGTGGGREEVALPENPPQVLNTLSSVSVRVILNPVMCDPQWFRDTASRGPTTIVAPKS
ncbi:hypothetical protein F511_16393 [Dorcoceras hygrometricum]|uniref:Uncharacterized protein n=1 Tax=Dorcoceras hygrometricum TaxID=472368 RepID=A0A2Z7DH82_9LAMI|nr:hypothetical protein F511_16393 [Dorcoceras hygrometricum]